MKYEPFATPRDFSFRSTQDAAQYLPPAHVFDLYVSDLSLIECRGMLHEMLSGAKDNPLAPHINLHACPEFSQFEWCLAVGDKAIGSKGA